MGVEISRASGFSEQMLNAGEIRNWGWELLLKTTPLRMDNGFRWDLTANWSKNNSEVVALYGDLTTLVLETMWSLNIEARKGEPYGVMFGNDVLRCRAPDFTGCTAAQEGLPILSAGGALRTDPERRVVGNYNPDWVGGLMNRFSYGPFDLSILVDGQSGGDVFSVTNYFGDYAGVLARTVEGREDDWDSPGFLNRGVLPDGTVNGEGGVDVRILSQDRFEGTWGKHTLAIDDATYMKLRELRCGYELPESWVGRFGFSGGNVALIARNLFMWAPNCDNIDPETTFDASNRGGLESGQFPSVRSIGFSMTITP